MNQIQGKVALVLTDRQLVINRGQNDGVEIGMQFAIMGNHQGEVRDPDSGETLGTVEVIKTIVKIVEVEERISLGKTFRTIKEGGGAFAMSSEISRAFTPSSVRVETLDQEGRFSEKEITPDKSYVKVGDLALQIVSAGSLSTTRGILLGAIKGLDRTELVKIQDMVQARPGALEDSRKSSPELVISENKRNSTKYVVRKTTKPTKLSSKGFVAKKTSNSGAAVAPKKGKS